MVDINIRYVYPTALECDDESTGKWYSLDGRGLSIHMDCLQSQIIIAKTREVRIIFNKKEKVMKTFFGLLTLGVLWQAIQYLAQRYFGVIYPSVLVEEVHGALLILLGFGAAIIFIDRDY